jgi:hypothetical protein
MEDGDSKRVKYEKIELRFLGLAMQVALTECTLPETKSTRAEQVIGGLLTGSGAR